MTHKNRKKLEISCFEVLDVLFWGMKAFLAAGTTFMEAVPVSHNFGSRSGFTVD